MKKIVSFLALLFLLLPSVANAYNAKIDGIYYNFSGDEATVTNDDGSNSYSGTVVIPESVTYNNKTYSVTSIGDWAFQDCSGLTSITIPNGVTRIGEAAFRGCIGLTSVTIPESVTRIGSDAFRNCIGLTSITIPNGVTSIGYGAFRECSGLTSVTIPEGVTSIGNYAFDSCSSLTTVTIESNTIMSKTWSGSSSMSSTFGNQVETYIIGNGVTSIGNSAFYNCSSLTSVTIGNSVTSIGDGAFFGCSGLTSVTIPGSVTSIGDGAFRGCSGLTSVTIPGSVTFIGDYAFQDCSGLTSVTIPNSVTSIGSSAFQDCSGLTSVTIGNGVTSIGEGAFYGCSGLTSVTIPNSVTSIGNYAFEGCSRLTSVTIPESVTSIGEYAFSGCESLISVTTNSNAVISSSVRNYKSSPMKSVFGEQVEEYIIGDNVKFISDEAFSGYSNLKSVSIGNGVTRIGNEAFSDCSSLTLVTIGSSVTSIGRYAFEDCSGLTDITIPNSVTSIGSGAFSGCNLECIEYSNAYYLGNEENPHLVLFEAKSNDIESCNIHPDCKVLAEGALSECRNLSYTEYSNAYYLGNEENPYIILIKATSEYISSCDIHPECKILASGAFYQCQNLTSVTIPDGMTSIGADAFAGSSSLISVSIPESVTSIGSSAFNGCRGLTSVTIPNSVTSIGDGAFEDCSGLTEVTIPNSVTSIGYGAFEGCSGLTSVTIGNGVTHIDSRAFEGCGLISVTIPANVVSIGDEAFSGCESLISVTTNSNAVISASEKDYYDDSPMKSVFGEQVEEYIIGDNVKFISDEAFSGYSNLKSVTIGNGVTNIGRRTFSGCSSLTSVDIPENVTSIGDYAFSGCSGLASITIPNGVTSIGWDAFSGCSGLTSVTIPNSVTSIGGSAFSGCSGLTSVTIESDAIMSKTWRSDSSMSSIFGNQVETYIIGNGVTSIGNYAFRDCSGLTGVTIPNSVTSIGDGAFYNCSSLTSVTIPNSVTSIGKYAFDGCSGLTSVTIPNSVTSIGDYAFYYCSGLTCFTIPDGVTSIGDGAFYYCSGLTSVTIPGSVTSIGDYAFEGCSGLTEIISYINNPSEIGEETFDEEVYENAILFVPAGSIDAYQTSEGWKNFANILILSGGYSIAISLPEGINTQDYAKMYLELTNMESGQKMHYVLTDRTTYTFVNIPSNTSWCITIRNERGDIFGQIDNVEVTEEDVSISFPSLSKPQAVVLAVLTPDGQNVTSQTQITWTDAEGNYLVQGASLTGLPIGYHATYSVALPQELAMTYVTPQPMDYVLTDGSNSITCRLDSIPQIQLSGKVKDAETGLPLSGSTVSVSQTFGGKHTKMLSAKTDSKGEFTLEVANVPTSMTFAATDYVSQTANYDNGLDGLDGFVVPDVSLKPIAGATISIDFVYTTVDGETQNWYSDYQNVSFELFNVTKDCAVSQFNVQYPKIVLLEDVEDGDVLRLTATSRTNAFMPVDATATIAEQKAEALFAIKELGKIQSTFVTTGNASVVGVLYDASGKLVKTDNYRNASLTIGDLTDGQYTLVSMGSSRLFNTIYDLAQLPQTGLAVGTDYVQNTVEVKSGEVSYINISQVPTLDESKLYYTGTGTSFMVNKPTIVAGNYLTFTGNIDFKPEFASRVRNVQLIVDIPESCQFIDNSVMVGTSTSGYMIDGNRVTISMANYTDRVRLCAIPTIGGDYAPSAFARFDLDGETIMQPIGSANYTVKDLSISVPSTVAKAAIPISGTAIGQSQVEIYDNDVLIDQTTSLANGTWQATCELNEPYNLSTHNIYAKVTTKAGLELISETKQVVYDKNMVVPEKVTMLYYNPEIVGQYNIVFDLINGGVSPKSYYFFPYKSYPNWRGSGTEPKDFTFIADLSNNDSTAVNGVTIRVYTDNGYWRNLEAQYNSSMNRWVAVSQFTEEEAPVGIDVVIDAKSGTIADRDKIDKDLSASNSLFSELEQNMDRVNHLLSVNQDEETSESFTVLQNYLESDNYDASEVNKWIQSVMYNQTSGDVMTDEMADSLTILYQKDLDDFTEKLKNSPDSSVFALLYLPTELNLLAPTSEDVSFEHEGYIYKQKKWTPVSVENLLNDGFLHYNLTDSTQVFFKYEDSGLIIIDTKKAVEFSMLPLDKANSRSNMPRRASDASGFALCVKDWNLLVTNILKYKDINTNLDLKNVLTIATQVRGTVQGIIDASSCFYRDYYITFKYNLDNSYKKFVKEIEDKIEARRNLIDKHWERIKVQNDMISQQEDMIRQYQKNIDELFAQAYNTSDPNVLDELEKQIKHNEDLIKASQEHIKLNKQIISDINTKDINQIEKQINRLSNEREAIEEGYKLAEKTVKRIPTLSKGKKAVSVWTKLGKLAGPLGILCDVADIFATGWEAYDEINEWIDLGEAMLRKLPCEGNPDEAELLCKDIVSNFIDVVAAYASILGTKAGATALNTVDVPVFTPHWWIASGLNIYAEWANLWASNKYISLRGDFWGRMYFLKCKKDDDKCPRCGKNPCECKDKCPRCGNRPCTCPDKCTRCGRYPCVCPPPPNTIDVQHDPSGYVYEGVASNRLQGVIASCYYKENVEDMYGDLHENVVLWDAKEYAQENPLFTDEYGMYRWDVPKGLWQVKFEKEGYETTYSDWLPVPPPQLDINIPMTQARQPEVKEAHAYEDGVEVSFDKYMMPKQLTTDNILVSQNGQDVKGEVVLMDEETTPEDESVKYASRVRFVPETPFKNGEVTLFVANRVRSYADVPMQDNYEQTFTIEKEVKEIVADSLVKVLYGGTEIIVVQVRSAEAAAGKTLNVKTSSPMILSIEKENYVIDEEGQAEITVKGELPGTAALTFSVEGTDKTATTIVNVEQAAFATISAPKASIASGSEVEKGTQITLSSETEGATIYYTLDGSCPCDENGSRMVYDGTPIVITKDVTIKTMAVAPDGAESEVVEFVYVIGTGIDGLSVDDDVQVYPLRVHDKLNVTAGGKLIKSVTVSSTSGTAVAASGKPMAKVTLDVSHIPAGIYIVAVTTEKGGYSCKIVKEQ